MGMREKKLQFTGKSCIGGGAHLERKTRYLVLDILSLGCHLGMHPNGDVEYVVCSGEGLG